MLQIRAKSRDSNNEWYDALVKAAEKRDAGKVRYIEKWHSLFPCVRSQSLYVSYGLKSGDKDGSQQKEKVKRGKSFNFFKKDKDKKEDGLAVVCHLDMYSRCVCSIQI